MSDFEILDSSEIEVLGPTGAKYSVIHEKEEEYWNDVVARYMGDYRFTNISDLQDLDRVLTMELMAYRYQQWISVEADYWGAKIDAEELNKLVREISKELRLLKKSLGMDKSSRDKDRGESAAIYIETLRKRAHEFGIMRSEQAVKSITLFQELKALLTLHDNCTIEERKESHIEIEDLIEWIRTVIVEFDSIDEQFREQGQKYWISEI